MLYHNQSLGVKKLQKCYKDIASDFHERFEQERKNHKGLTNRKIAKDMGISETAVSLYTNGQFTAINEYLLKNKFKVPA